ncbi:MAG: sulfite exporter TauE/SafE family protein [Clostridia bacterium]|nr:sulfite exporter TauE/SafE family protein [Clostridia bacterium]
MMLILISSISSILAGMGIGGGAIFVLLSTMFVNFDQKEAQLLNLISFLSVSFGATIFNITNKEVDVKMAKKMLPFTVIGSLVGTYFFNKINEQKLSKYFTYFLLLIGIYEIISSVNKMKKEKNNTK